MEFYQKNTFLENSLHSYKASVIDAYKRSGQFTWLINDMINNVTFTLLYKTLRECNCYRDFIPRIEKYAIDCKGEDTTKCSVDGDKLEIRARLRYPVGTITEIKAVITTNIKVLIKVEPEGPQRVLEAESELYSLDEIPIEDINSGVAVGNYEKWLLT